MFKNCLSTLTAASAVAFVAAAAYAGDTAQTFTPKFTKGAEQHYTLNYTTTSKINGMGQAQTTEIKREVRVTTRVKDVDTNGATFDFTYDHIALNLRDGQRQLAFDSKNPAAQDSKTGEFDQIRPICGQTFTVKVGNDGEVISVTPPANFPPATSMSNATRDFVTTDGVQRLFGTIWGFDNDKAVKQGETWPVNRIVTNPPIDLRVTTTFKFDEQKGDIATVTSKSSAVVEPTKSGNPLPFNLSDFKANGTYAWNAKLGTLENSSFSWVAAKTGDLQGMKLDMTDEYTMNLKREPSSRADAE